MREIKIIGVKILDLIIDVFLLGVKLLKHLVLPDKINRGNRLLSLLVFFIGLIERLDLFEHGFFNMATVFRQKYVRRTVILIGGILFILASFDCALQNQNNNDRTTAVGLISSIKHTQKLINPSLKVIKNQVYLPVLIQNITCTNTAFISPLKKYLFTHRLLI